MAEHDTTLDRQRQLGWVVALNVEREGQRFSGTPAEVLPRVEALEAHCTALGDERTLAEVEATRQEVSRRVKVLKRFLFAWAESMGRFYRLREQLTELDRDEQFPERADASRQALSALDKALPLIERSVAEAEALIADYPRQLIDQDEEFVELAERVKQVGRARAASSWKAYGTSSQQADVLTPEGRTHVVVQ